MFLTPQVPYDLALSSPMGLRTTTHWQRPSPHSCSWPYRQDVHDSVSGEHLHQLARVYAHTTAIPSYSTRANLEPDSRTMRVLIDGD